jgi:hypothetical protein
MKHSDFHIGLEFLGLAGFRWRCTDVGTRTVVAIQLDHDDDPNWYQGPPYIAKEVVFEEHDFERCHLTEEEAIRIADPRGRHVGTFGLSQRRRQSHDASPVRDT